MYMNIYTDEPKIGLPIRNKAGDLIAWTYIDPDDSNRLSKFKWSLKGGYAYRGAWNKELQKVETFYMHREVMGLRKAGNTNQTRDKTQIDHINRDRLDNRRSNLRLASHILNHQNLSGVGTGESGYRGVFKSPAGTWRARVHYLGKHYYFGTHKTPEEAALAAAEGRRKLMPFSNN